MILSLLISLLVFAGITVGLAWPAASRLALDPSEKPVATVALSLLGVHHFTWMFHVRVLPHGLLWILPTLSVVGRLTRRLLDGVAVDFALATFLQFSAPAYAIHHYLQRGIRRAASRPSAITPRILKRLKRVLIVGDNRCRRSWPECCSRC